MRWTREGDCLVNIRTWIERASRLHVSITNPVEARRIRAISVASLYFGIAALIFVVCVTLTGVIASLGMAMALALAGIISIGVHWILRSRHYRYGVWIFLVTAMSIIHLRPLNSTLGADRLIVGLAFVPAIQALGILVLSHRTAMRFLAVNFGFVLLAFALRPDIIIPTGIIMGFILAVQSLTLVLLATVTDMERDFAEKAAANTAVAEIVAGIAHGINSPLAAAKTMSARLKRKMSGEGSVKGEDVTSLVAKLDSTVDRTLIISKSLQFFVEPPTSAASGDFFNLTAVCQDALELCNQAFQLQHLNVVFDPDASADVLVKGSKDRVTHAIVNLMSSSFKIFATGEEGTIHLTIEPYGDRVILKVGDSVAHDMANLQILLANRATEGGNIERGGDIELRMAKRLFERCGATLDIGNDPDRDKFRIAIARHIIEG